MGQDIPSPEAAYNKLPLTQFPALQSMLSPMAGNTSTVIVDAPQYFQKLDQAIKSMDVELVKYYVMFKVLNNERLGPFLPEALVKPRNDFEDAVDKLPEPKGGPAPKGTRKRRVRKRNIYMPPQDPLSFAGEGEGEKRKVQCAQAGKEKTKSLRSIIRKCTFLIKIYIYIFEILRNSRYTPKVLIQHKLYERILPHRSQARPRKKGSTHPRGIREKRERKRLD